MAADATLRMKYLEDVRSLPHIGGPYEPSRISELRVLRNSKIAVIKMLQLELMEIEDEMDKAMTEYNTKIGLRELAERENL